MHGNSNIKFNNLLPKIVPFYEIIWKMYCIGGQVTDDNLAHAHYMMDN